MRTISYTYDEGNPTNRDYLVAALSGNIDDGGASYESATRYSINCPYFGFDDCLNEHEGNKYDTPKYIDGCVRCKLSWLLRKYDTYPSDDGKWGIFEEDE